MRINWKRLAWVIFIYLYTGLFFYNCLRPFSYWLVSYIYTMILVIWLGVEYYLKNLFFQSGFLPFELYKWPLRASFALFFYSSFIVGISTTIWWTKNRIELFPLIQIIGVAILIVSVYLRWKNISAKTITTTSISQFYLSLILLIISLALGYGSYFLIFFTVVVGLPLVFLQYKFEVRIFKEFEHFTYSKQQVNKIKAEHYEKLWHKYLEQKFKKTTKK